MKYQMLMANVDDDDDRVYLIGDIRQGGEISDANGSPSNSTRLL